MCPVGSFLLCCKKKKIIQLRWYYETRELFHLNELKVVEFAYIMSLENRHEQAIMSQYYKPLLAISKNLWFSITVILTNYIVILNCVIKSKTFHDHNTTAVNVFQPSTLFCRQFFRLPNLFSLSKKEMGQYLFYLFSRGKGGTKCIA